MNIMAADVLAMQSTRAQAAVIETSFSRNMPVSAPIPLVIPLIVQLLGSPQRTIIMQCINLIHFDIYRNLG